MDWIRDSKLPFVIKLICCVVGIAVGLVVGGALIKVFMREYESLPRLAEAAFIGAWLPLVAHQCLSSQAKRVSLFLCSINAALWLYLFYGYSQLEQFYLFESVLALLATTSGFICHYLCQKYFFPGEPTVKDD